MLKRYSQILNEEVESVAQENNPVTNDESGINFETISEKYNKLKNSISKKIEENKKLISEYYNKTTKDGQEINNTDEYYTYGRYVGNDEKAKALEDRNMIFTIKIDEITASGMTFSVIKGEKIPDVKIDSKEIEIIKKQEAVIKLTPGYINGKYMVKSIDKINLLKPKEEIKSSEKQGMKIKDELTIKSNTDVLIKFIKQVGNKWDKPEYRESIETIYDKTRASIGNIDKQLEKLSNEKVKNKESEKQQVILNRNKELLNTVIKALKEYTGLLENK